MNCNWPTVMVVKTLRLSLDPGFKPSILWISLFIWNGIKLVTFWRIGSIYINLVDLHFLIVKNAYPLRFTLQPTPPYLTPKVAGDGGLSTNDLSSNSSSNSSSDSSNNNLAKARPTFPAVARTTSEATGVGSATSIRSSALRNETCRMCNRKDLAAGAAGASWVTAAGGGALRLGSRMLGCRAFWGVLRTI